MWEDIGRAITAATGAPFTVRSHRPVGGGCINEAVCLQGDGASYFIKLNAAGSLAMFEAEAAGLAAIRASRSLRAPRPVASGGSHSRSWLALEYVEFSRPRPGTSAVLGEQLAEMHRTSAESYGWERDNTIGTTPQANGWMADWTAFWRTQRLGRQLQLAAGNGARASLLAKGERLQHSLTGLFDGHRPQPSLLHGDLWGGNWGADKTGRPVIFDPAVYFGDREADLAMTELFGGFETQFYHAYNAAWPLDSGYATRKQLYNLYHILNHFNLFGGGYEAQAEAIMDSLLAELAGQA